MKKRTIALLMAVVMLFGVTVGGTIAWIQANTDEVVNTFTIGEIKIELDESKLKDDGKTIDTTVDRVKENNNYKMIPGNDLQKDPQVRVLDESEACWLFVKVTPSDNFATYMTWEIAEGWTALDGQTGVYYREVDSMAGTDETTNAEFYVLKDNKVTVLDSVTESMLETAKANAPTLKIDAYAVQKDNIATAAAAWEALNS